MIGEFIKEALKELFIIFDDLIITVVIVAVICAVMRIVYPIIKSEYEHKEYIKKRNEKEKRRLERVSRIAIKDRKCSKCRYGKKAEGCEQYGLYGFYECSHPEHIITQTVQESENINCPKYDT